MHVVQGGSVDRCYLRCRNSRSPGCLDFVGLSVLVFLDPVGCPPSVDGAVRVRVVVAGEVLEALGSSGATIACSSRESSTSMTSVLEDSLTLFLGLRVLQPNTLIRA